MKLELLRNHREDEAVRDRVRGDHRDCTGQDPLDEPQRDSERDHDKVSPGDVIGALVSMDADQLEQPRKGGEGSGDKSQHGFQ